MSRTKQKERKEGKAASVTEGLNPGQWQKSFDRMFRKFVVGEGELRAMQAAHKFCSKKINLHNCFGSTTEDYLKYIQKHPDDRGQHADGFKTVLTDEGKDYDFHFCRCPLCGNPDIDTDVYSVEVNKKDKVRALIRCKCGCRFNGDPCDTWENALWTAAADWNTRIKADPEPRPEI